MIPDLTIDEQRQFISTKLKKIREKRCTIYEAYKGTEINQVYLGRMEKGEINYRVSKLLHLLKYLKASLVFADEEGARKIDSYDHLIIEIENKKNERNITSRNLKELHDINQRTLYCVLKQETNLTINVLSKLGLAYNFLFYIKYEEPKDETHNLEVLKAKERVAFKEILKERGKSLFYDVSLKLISVKDLSGCCVTYKYEKKFINSYCLPMYSAKITHGTGEEIIAYSFEGLKGKILQSYIL